MRYLTACGLAAAALLMCDLTVHAQAMRTGGGTSLGSSSLGSSSSGFGGGGGLGGGSSLGSSNGFGNGGNGQFSFSGGTSFVGSSSQSFAGGSGGGSFTGGSGGSSFTGGSSSFTGGNGSGGYGIGGGGGFRGGSVSTGVSSMNPFRSTFGNPLAPGLISGASNAAFGQALYSNLSPTSTNLLGGTTSGLGGLGGTARIGGGGTTGSTSQSGGNYGALGIANRNSVVVALPGGFVPAGPGPNLASPGAAAIGQAPQLNALPASMQENLRSLLSRSSVSPATQSAVTFGLDGGTVVLRGTAASAADARAIESLIRFAPRVGGVRNEMTWK
jgi:hypothetical protein